MPTPNPAQLVQWQRDLEAALSEFADDTLAPAFARTTDPALHATSRDYALRPSKRLVGLLFLVAYHGLVDGRPRHTAHDLTLVAVALELRHAAILVHDDIVDQDDARGGIPTAPAALTAASYGPEGQSAAIFAGDALAHLAPLPVLRSRLPHADQAALTDWLLSTALGTAVGQAQQLYLDTVPAVEGLDEDAILATHAPNMTAATVGCSLGTAALLGGHPRDLADLLLGVSERLGAVLQVQNDLAGFAELERVLADPGGDQLTLANTSDLQRRRRTLLVHAAVARLSSDERQRFLRLFGGEDPENLRPLAAAIRSSGAYEHCTARLAALVGQARRDVTQEQRLPPAIRRAMLDACQFVEDLYDPASPVSRLYLQARPDLVAPSR